MEFIGMCWPITINEFRCLFCSLLLICSLLKHLWSSIDYLPILQLLACCFQFLDQNKIFLLKRNSKRKEKEKKLMSSVDCSR